ncbi:hypothetical protein N752_01300 [Desulforamulus aquiferis]|nr:DUF502 domain-containing protein [Desulforamulus aquiferis]RYD06955.1 hypothetical protein N752_01300 [Desulforamulus aquiferis]
MKKIINTFLAGISAILPLGLTTFIIYKLFMFVDSLTANLIASLLGKKVIGLGFITTVLIVFLVGMITKNFIGKKLISWADNIFEQIPFAQTIYKAAKEIINTILNKDKNSFKQPVLIDFPSKGLKSVGFLTNDSVMVDGEERYLVFIPTTPNPTTGFLVCVKKSEVELLNISVDEATKIIISLGVITPKILTQLI